MIGHFGPRKNLKCEMLSKQLEKKTRLLVMPKKCKRYLNFFSNVPSTKAYIANQNIHITNSIE